MGSVITSGTLSWLPVGWYNVSLYGAAGGLTGLPLSVSGGSVASGAAGQVLGCCSGDSADLHPCEAGVSLERQAGVLLAGRCTGGAKGPDSVQPVSRCELMRGRGTCKLLHSSGCVLLDSQGLASVLVSTA